MIVVWLGRIGFMILMLTFGLSAALFLASFGDASWIYTGGLPLTAQLSDLLYSRVYAQLAAALAACQRSVCTFTNPQIVPMIAV